MSTLPRQVMNAMTNDEAFRFWQLAVGMDVNGTPTLVEVRPKANAIEWTGLALNLEWMQSVHIERSGAWWLDWVTCWETTREPSAATSGAYPRWNVRVRKQATRVPNDLSQQLLAQVFDGQEESLAYIRLMADNSSAQHRFPLHHVALRAKDNHPVLPSTLGQASSVSHLCDNHLCCRREHIELTMQHVDNMARQRCSGVVLTHLDGTILQELPCPHASGDSHLERIGTSCRRLRLQQMDEVGAARGSELWIELANAVLNGTGPTATQVSGSSSRRTEFPSQRVH